MMMRLRENLKAAYPGTAGRILRLLLPLLMAAILLGITASHRLPTDPATTVRNASLLAVLLALWPSARIWYRTGYAPAEDGRSARLLLLPYSRSDLALGTFGAGVLTALYLWLVSFVLYMVGLALLPGLIFPGMMTALRLGIAELLALLTLSAAQYRFAVGARTPVGHALVCWLLPLLFLVMAGMPYLPERFDVLRSLTPVSLTVSKTIMEGRPSLMRYVLQILFFALLLHKAVRIFAKRDLRLPADLGE